MWFVITVMLTFNSGEVVSREYLQETFPDTWICHRHITDNKVELLLPHLQENLKSFEFFCESRYGAEV